MDKTEKKKKEIIFNHLDAMSAIYVQPENGEMIRLDRTEKEGVA